MEINLSGKNGGTALISKKDFALLSKYTWSMNTSGYVSSTVDRKSVLMHRYIMDAEEDDIVDHINRIKHDNRRENLRFLTKTQNAQNTSKRKNTSSQYRGVTYRKTTGKYNTCITLDHIHYSLGAYDDEVKAAEEVDMFWVHNKHDHIELNFPDKREIYLEREYIPYTKKFVKNGISDEGTYFRARIMIDGENEQIAKSKNYIKCAELMDQYIVDNNIPNKRLNFPENHPNYNPISIVKVQCETIDDDTVKLILPKYPDKAVLVDKEDYDKIKYYSWYINGRYVIARVGGKCTKLHRFLMNMTDPKILVDHINSNSLDNTKNNLRISDNSKNSRNKKKKENTKSEYIGICPSGNGWTSHSKYNGIDTYIAHDVSEKHAARRRDIHILDHFPNEHCKMNFEWTDADIVIWKKKLSIVPHSGKILEYVKKICYGLLDDDFRSVTKFNSLYASKLKVRTNKYEDYIFQ